MPKAKRCRLSRSVPLTRTLWRQRSEVQVPEVRRIPAVSQGITLPMQITQLEHCPMSRNMLCSTPIDRRMDECQRTKPLSLQRSARRLIVKASARPWQRHQEHQERHPRTNQAGPLKAQAPCSYAFSDRPPLKAEQPTVTYAARCICSHATRIRAPTASGIMRRSYGRSPLQPRARLAPHIHWPASVRQDSRYALRNVAPRFH